MDLKQIFGIVLKQHRQDLSISQEEFASRCNLDRTYISLLERGKRNPTLSTIFVIAENLGIHPSVLIDQVTLMNEKIRTQRQ